MGPFSATRLRRTDSTAPSVTNCPEDDAFSDRASTSSQSTWTPAASRTRRVAAATSGPIPSPGISVTLCRMAHLIVCEGDRVVETRSNTRFPDKKSYVQVRCAVIDKVCYTLVERCIAGLPACGGQRNYD